MAHPNRIYNGDFATDLNSWTATGAVVHTVGQGNLELGCAYIPAGGSLSQAFSIGIGRMYTLDVAAKVSSSGSLTVVIGNDGGTLFEQAQVLTTSWAGYLFEIGLPWGTHTLTITMSDGGWVDDVSVAWVIKSRLELAADVAAKLGVLATGASLSTTPSGANTEGDYTGAVDYGLRMVGAVDGAGRPDTRYLDADNVIVCLNQIEIAMLTQLQRYWMTKTNYTIGPRTEYLNQVSQALLQLTSNMTDLTAGRTVRMSKLRHANTL